MRARLRSLEQLMPFTTAGELIAAKRQPLVSVAPGATARAAVTGLTHKDSYRDIFAITLLKTAAVGVAIGVFYLTGIY